MTSMVEDGGILRDESVAVEVVVVGRCFPKWTRRSEDAGREVRSESSWRSVGIVVDEGICSGMAMMMVSIYQEDCDFSFAGNVGSLSPDMSLTKI